MAHAGSPNHYSILDRLLARLGNDSSDHGARFINLTRRRFAGWPARTIKVSRDARYRHDYSPAHGIAGFLNIIGGLGERPVQAMVCVFVVRWDVVERVRNRHAIASELLQQFDMVVIAHHRDFVGRLKMGNRVEGRGADSCSERIETTATVD